MYTSFIGAIVRTATLYILGQRLLPSKYRLRGIYLFIYFPIDCIMEFILKYY